MRRIGNILYYSVDHTPTLLWDSASWEISCSLLPYLEGFEEKRYDAVLEDAVDVREGVVVNKDILSFQHRSPIFPYPVEKQEERDRVLG
jgi:alanine dehydrogenase